MIKLSIHIDLYTHLNKEPLSLSFEFHMTLMCMKVHMAQVATIHIIKTSYDIHTNSIMH